MIKLFAKQLVYHMINSLQAYSTSKFSIIWIGRNFCNSMDACLFQFLKEMD